MENRYPRRKQNRLKNYDYSTPGVYFLTFCVKDRKCLLWNNVGACIARQRDVQLSEYGEIVRTAIELIPKKYPMVSVNYYTIMPNHVHLLLFLKSDEKCFVEVQGNSLDEIRMLAKARIPEEIQQFKARVSWCVGKNVWHGRYHDHIVRNQREYEMIYNYIENNPGNWDKDCYL